jgi:osmotically-inducible protein OsmY
MKALTKIAIQTVVLAGMFVPATQAMFAQQAETQQPTATDNSKMNRQDRDNKSATADQQKENPADRDLSRQVRKSIMQDKSLSTYAHNVKVIAQNGTVTLKGPVRSEDEKQAISSKAAEVAGSDKVVNDLTVVPEQK